MIFSLTQVHSQIPRASTTSWCQGCFLILFENYVHMNGFFIQAHKDLFSPFQINCRRFVQIGMYLHTKTCLSACLSRGICVNQFQRKKLLELLYLIYHKEIDWTFHLICPIFPLKPPHSLSEEQNKEDQTQQCGNRKESNKV